MTKARGHERIAIDTRDEGGRWRRIAVHVGSRVAFQQIDADQ